MRILMLAHRIPYPPHTGDKVRAYHVARHLAHNHDLTLACLVDDRADLAGLDALRQRVGHVEYARLCKPWSLTKGLSGIAAGRPFSIPYFASKQLRRRLAGPLARSAYDLIYVSSAPMAQYARGLGIPVVMDFVDVDSDKWAQYGRHTAPPRSWLYQLEGHRLRMYEGSVAQWARLCLLATPAEEELLKSFAPWAKTAVVPNGVDLTYFAPRVGEPMEPAILFTGAMDYLPNRDAVQHFCADILPLVRHEIPAVRFWVVGLNPSREVRRLGEMPGVVVTGAVPDVRPYYARAAVCVAPLRIGRGVQNKVLQSMAVGVPVVASPLAGRGIDAQPGKHLYVECDPAEFAARLVSLLRNPTEGRALVRQARAFVEANHSWESSFSRIDALLRDHFHLRGVVPPPVPVVASVAPARQGDAGLPNLGEAGGG